MSPAAQLMEARAVSSMLATLLMPLLMTRALPPMWTASPAPGVGSEPVQLLYPQLLNVGKPPPGHAGEKLHSWYQLLLQWGVNAKSTARHRAPPASVERAAAETAILGNARIS